MKYLLLPALTLFFSFPSFAGYVIHGHIQHPEIWQTRVTLATVNTPEDLFITSPDYVINSAPVSPDGSFTLSGDYLPDDLRFYRIAVTSGNNILMNLPGDNSRNSFHLILNNDSRVRLEIPKGQHLFLPAVYGSKDNEILCRVQKDWTERKYLLSQEQSSVKSSLMRSSLERYLKQVADTCHNALIGLYAIYHIENKEAGFLTDSPFYEKFQQKLHQQYPQSLYTGKYDELMKQFIGFRNIVCDQPNSSARWKDYLIILETLLIGFLTYRMIRLRRQNRSLTEPAQEASAANTSLRSFTSKEQQILTLLAEGKTNKEIAQELFVEISTVKTHINNIYRRLNVSNRKEAISAYHTMIKSDSELTADNRSSRD